MTRFTRREFERLDRWGRGDVGVSCLDERDGCLLEGSPRCHRYRREKEEGFGGTVRVVGNKEGSEELTGLPPPSIGP